MTKQWNKFSTNPKTKTAIWSVQKDEFKMMEAFYEVEKRAEGKTSDLFLKFDAPYTNHNDYTKRLIQEFNQLLKVSEKDFKAADIDIANWQNLKSNNFHPGLFAKTLESFNEFIDIDGNIVAYLSPQKNANIPAWTDWIDKLNSVDFFNVKIMLIEMVHYPVFDGLLSNNKTECVRLIPALNMDQAMTELAAQGNPSDPGTKFRQLYVVMMQAAGEGDLKETKALAKQALIHTRRYGMVFMEATVYLILGGVYISHKKKKEAIGHYDQAIALLEQDKTNPKLAKQQIVMAHLSKGMALFINKQYELATSVYEKAALGAKSIDNNFLAMDAWRMTGTCYNKISYSKDAKASFQKAVKVGMQIDEKNRRQTTMPLAAMELFLLETPKGRIKLNEDMKNAIGKDWQELADIKNHLEKV